LLDHQNNYTENLATMNKDVKNVDILAIIRFLFSKDTLLMKRIKTKSQRKIFFLP